MERVKQSKYMEVLIMETICALCFTTMLVCLALLVIGFTLMAIASMVTAVIDDIRVRFK